MIKYGMVFGERLGVLMLRSFDLLVQELMFLLGVFL